MTDPQKVKESDLKTIDNYQQINKVLWITLISNFFVAIIKLVIGFVFKISTLIADGLHSVSDSFINIVGLIAVRFSQKRSDKKHPYGYEKYETLGTFIVAILIFFLAYETLFLGIKNLSSETLQHEISPIVFISIIATIIINIITSIYELRRGKKLKSEFLIADATETRSDIVVSAGVMVSLVIMMYTDFPLDGILPILISILIIKNAWGIFKEVAITLADGNIVEIDRIKEIVMSHPKVKFCHAIRSRGKPDAIFIDFHLGVEDNLTVKEAHDEISHEVKLLLKKNIDGLKSALIHIEPQSADQRKKSVFIETDYYGYKDN